MAGLHDMAPICSRAKLTSATLAPIRAAAAAASQPAWPPPTTMMSKSRVTPPPLPVPRGTVNSLTDAEAPEQSVQHILHSGGAHHRVQRRTAPAQPLGHQQQVAGRSG